jgi:Na+/proline symporter
MTISLRFCRISTSVEASVFGVIAIIIAAIVIPAVRADTFPLATPDRAVTAFWVAVFLFFLLAAVLLLMSLRITKRGVFVGLLASGVVGLVVSLAQLDAADAFSKHGPELQTADVFLYICFAVGTLASVSLLLTALFLRKARREADRQSIGSSESVGSQSS